MANLLYGREFSYPGNNIMRSYADRFDYIEEAVYFGLRLRLHREKFCRADQLLLNRVLEKYQA